MSSISQADWTQQKERVTGFWLKIILNLALKLPRRAVYWLLHPIVVFYLLISARQISVSRHYLDQALGRKSTVLDVYRHFLWFATVILDRVYFLSGRERYFKITYENLSEWKASMEVFPAQLYFGAHFGSLEAIRLLSQDSHQVQIKAVVKIDQNEKIVQLLNQLNPDFSEGVIPHQGMGTIFAIHDALESGFSVALLKDRPVGEEKTVEVQFFNDRIQVPISGFKLAQKRNIPVVLFFGRYEGRNHYHVVSKSLSFSPTMSLQEMAQSYMNEVEAQCRISPYNWFNFYRYWR